MKKTLSSFVIALSSITGCVSNSLENQAQTQPSIIETAQSQASQFYNSFPETIPGIRKIEKYPAENAKFCFVHFKSIHVPARQKEALPEAEKEEIRKVKSDIYKGLEYLSDKSNVKFVYAEGVTSETIKDVKCYLDKLTELNMESLEVEKKDIKKSINALEIQLENDGRSLYFGEKERQKRRSETYNLINFMENAIQMDDRAIEAYNGVREDILISKGASFTLYLDKKMNVKPAEDAEIFKNLIEEYLKFRDYCEKLTDPNIDKSSLVSNMEEYKRLNYTVREDALINTIYENNDNIALVEFGAVHNFKDNKEKWNKNHSNAKFSLIVLTPENYK